MIWESRGILQMKMDGAFTGMPVSLYHESTTTLGRSAVFEADRRILSHVDRTRSLGKIWKRVKFNALRDDQPLADPRCLQHWGSRYWLSRWLGQVLMPVGRFAKYAIYCRAHLFGKVVCSSLVLRHHYVRLILKGGYLSSNTYRTLRYPYWSKSASGSTTVAHSNSGWTLLSRIQR